jgi:hypothetical protein
VVLPYLEGFGAGPACPKGQPLLFVGDLTGQVRFAPLRGHDIQSGFVGQKGHQTASK